MTTIIVDGNNLGIGSHFANVNLSDTSGRPTGAIYGFIRSIRPILARIQRETGSDNVRVSVAWDSMTSWRKDLLPSYKASRSEKDADVSEEFEKYIDQIPRLRDVISMLGISQLRADNFEADDIAGYCARTLKNQIVLVSNDYDWLQLVSNRVHVWRTLKMEYVTPTNFKEYTLCDNTEEFVKMKSIAGDKDEVPGVAGVGDKTALKYLRGELTKGKKFDAIEEWMQDEEGFERSKSLFDLRTVQIPRENWKITPGRFDVREIIPVFQELSFNSILSDAEDWLGPFKASAVQADK